jgi:hypothetical protein
MLPRALLRAYLPQWWSVVRVPGSGLVFVYNKIAVPFARHQSITIILLLQRRHLSFDLQTCAASISHKALVRLRAETIGILPVFVIQTPPS